MTVGTKRSSKSADEDNNKLENGEKDQYLSVAHSGVRIVKRQKSLPTDYLEVCTDWPV